jgi:large subunit ribosomal protein L19e
MKGLDKRKDLASKVLGVGRNRIIFDSSRLAEIKEAITKQDIRDLYAEGLITIRDLKGRRTKPKRKTRRGKGKIKRKVALGKKHYVIIVRKLRRYIKELRIQNKVSKEQYDDIRKKIKSRVFKDKSHLKDYLGGLK